MKKPHVVIVGAGFGGVYTARYLDKYVQNGTIDVTIINRNNYFLFTPLLHEVATGGLTPLSVTEPIREIFQHSKTSFIQAEVTSIDTVAKEVSIKVQGIEQPVPYDYVVISSGADTNFYGITGAEEHSYTLKDLAGALDVRNRIIDLCEQAAITEDPIARKKLLTFVVVGGGATGVEVAAEIREFVCETLALYINPAFHDESQVVLLAASPELLPQFEPKLREIARNTLERKHVVVKTSMKVTEVTADSVVIEGNPTIDTAFVLWVAGVKAMSPRIPGLQYHQSGRIMTDKTLRAQNVENMFVLGDTGTADETGKMPPMLAQVAAQQAQTVASNIIALKNSSKLHEFTYKSLGNLVSLGQWDATGIIMGVTLQGPLMWFIWRTAYLFKFQSMRKRFKIIIEWTANLFYPRDITKVR